MCLNRTQFLLKRVPFSMAVRQFFRGFLSTEELLPLTLQDICRTCPMNGSRESHDNLTPEDREKIEKCRKRYFGALLQSYLGKAGDQETDWLYSYLKKCEECNFHNRI